MPIAQIYERSSQAISQARRLLMQCEEDLLLDQKYFADSHKNSPKDSIGDGQSVTRTSRFVVVDVSSSESENDSDGGKSEMYEMDL